MKKTNKKLSIIALALVACLMVAGISAYFTDGDTATNTFTVGKISIDLQEPNWEEPEDITPNETFAKDPQVKNDGVNEAFVYLEVAVPYAEVIVAGVADGVEAAATNTELYTYETNANWVQIGYLNNEGELVADPVYRDDETVVHLYAYGTDTALTKLDADATTPALFEEITFVNVVEDQGLEESTLEVVINAYAIQTENLTDADTTDPTAVWAILDEQAPVVNDK